MIGSNKKFIWFNPNFGVNPRNGKEVCTRERKRTIFEGPELLHVAIVLKSKFLLQRKHDKSEKYKKNFDVYST